MDLCKQQIFVLTQQGLVEDLSIYYTKALYTMIKIIKTFVRTKIIQKYADEPQEPDVILSVEDSKMAA
jgi:hypothetical protein